MLPGYRNGIETMMLSDVLPNHRTIAINLENGRKPTGDGVDEPEGLSALRPN